MEIVISIPKLILVQLSKQQTNAIINLRAQSRYDHFIKQIADCEEVWGLYNDGWAVAADNSGTEVLPVWPANEYARICTTHDWEAYEPMSIALDCNHPIK